MEMAQKTEEELISLLDDMADSWRNQPHLSNEGSESIAYHEIKKALEDQYNLTAYIVADKYATDYQVTFSKSPA